MPIGVCTFRARLICVKIAGMSAAAPESDPIALYLRLAERARVEGIDTAPAALATAGGDGRPSVRIVLLRRVDARGFVFFTNYESRKGRELKENPRAALCQHWPTLEEQIRVEGPTERIDAAESDAYFAARPRESQLGAWASNQSGDLEGRHALEARFDEIERRFANQPVPRPPHWGGIRIIPERIEFWYGRSGRLHDRLLYTRAGTGWQTSWLFP
jgi:pyridoxamine 5'-phosphate oxidase